MKVDVLAIGVHPDDVELGCGGTILKHLHQGYKVGILDLTRGELGTRGTAQTRDSEATNAAKILGVAFRDNLGFADGFFTNDREHQLKLIQAIRKYQPSIVITNAERDRHPDHGRASQLTEDACFLSGLAKIETKDGGPNQAAWRPKAIYHYVQAHFMDPDVVVDISGFMERKMEAVLAFNTQFYDPESKEPETFISSPEFLKLVESRAIELGKSIGVNYGEGFTKRSRVGTSDLLSLL